MGSTFLKIKDYLLGKNKNKIVYRFISERELCAIENQDRSQIGAEWERRNCGNTHKYEKGVRYVHFLDNKKDSMILYKELGFGKQYFCTYSIPSNILRKHMGKGFYIPSGYDLSYTVKEYAIPSEEFNPNWLISTQTIQDFLIEESMKMNK